MPLYQRLVLLVQYVQRYQEALLDECIAQTAVQLAIRKYELAMTRRRMYQRLMKDV